MFDMRPEGLGRRKHVEIKGLYGRDRDHGTQEGTGLTWSRH